MARNLLDLQSLRGGACMAVVLHHMGSLEAGAPWRYRFLKPFEGIGFASVDAFFVLSGFIIYYANAGRLGRRDALRPYLRDRLWRVYPTYWVCFLGIAILFHWVLDTCYYPGYFRDALYHFVLWPKTSSNFVIPQAWTLRYEVLFYFGFGVLFLLPRRFAPAFLTLWFLAGLGYSLFVPPGVPTVVLPLSPYTLEFLLGIAAAATLLKWGPILGGAARLVAVVWLLAAFVALGDAGFVELVRQPLLRLAVLGVPVALLVYGLAARETNGRTVFPRWLRPVGDASYSIYMVHMAVLWAFQRGGAFATERTVAGQLFLIAAQLVAVLTAGWCVYRVVERPILRYSKRGRVRAAEPPVPVEVRRAA